MRKGLIAAGVILAAIGIAGLFWGDWGKGNKLESFDKSWTFHTGQMRELAVQSNYEVNVTFVKGTEDTGKIQITGTGSPQAADAIRKTELHDDALRLDLRSKGTFRLFVFNFNDARQQANIVVTLPKDGQLEHFGLQGDSGNLSVSGASAKDMEIRVDSGNIKIQDSQSDNVVLSADSGNIEMQNLNSGTIRGKADSGNIRGNGVHAADMEFQADSGSVRIEDMTGIARIRADSGNVRLVKNDTANTEIHTDSGNVHVQIPSTFAGTFDLRSESGRIKAPESKRETGDLLYVRTDSGNIEMKQ